MKNCEICKASHDRVGRRTCGAQACLHELLARKRKNAQRRARHQAYTDLGMRRVKGSLGGTYYKSSILMAFWLVCRRL